MWYVIQVRTGAEESIRIQCGKLIDRHAMERCFIPYCEKMKRYHGEWHKEKLILFPGYLFVVSQDVEALFLELNRIIGLTKLLGTGNVIVPLTLEEESFLKQMGNDDQIVTMSKGLIVNNQVIVLAGPLKGREGYIRKVDRHKRRARLELHMFGRNQNVELGLEILEKIEDISNDREKTNLL